MSRVDWKLYSVVNLHRQSTCRAFLRTIETSPNKSQAFFATHVKSLCISLEVDNDRTVRIISACRGVTSLTFWVVPMNTPRYQSRALHYELVEALAQLRPKRLSTLLHDVLGPPNPHLPSPFIEKITHLSIINRWEDWVKWSGFDLFPCLTRISFELRVGPKPLRDSQTTTISCALQDILGQCARLQVCIVQLAFDQHPMSTAAAILGIFREADPRLVFIEDKEPFFDREAHSLREIDVWKRAEETVERQRSGSGGSCLSSVWGNIHWPPHCLCRLYCSSRLTKGNPSVSPVQSRLNSLSDVLGWLRLDPRLPRSDEGSPQQKFRLSILNHWAIHLAIILLLYSSSCFRIASGSSVIIVGTRGMYLESHRLICDCNVVLADKLILRASVAE